MTGLKKYRYPHIGEKLYAGVLANGLQVILIPKTDFDETCGLLAVDFGSLHRVLDYKGENRSYPAGIAHFLEHKLFEMPNGDDVAYLFTNLGAESNAFTTFDKTCYYFSTTEKVLDNLQLLQDFVFKPSFSEQSVEREKEIIKQEIDMYQDDADYRLYQGILENLYPKTALAEDVAGTAASIQAISVQDLAENHELFYQPQHMTLLLVGNFDSQAVFSEIETKQFFHEQEKIDFTVDALPVPEEVLRPYSVQMDISKPKLAVGYRGTALEFGQSLLRQKLSLQLFFSLLIGWTSEQYQQFYEAGQIDDSFDIDVEVENDFQFVIISLDTSEPIAMSNKIRQHLKKALQPVDMSEEQFQILKREMYGDFLRSLDAIDNLAMQFITHLSPTEIYFNLPDILQDLNLTEVRETGRKFLSQAEVTDFTIFPKLNRNSL